jgi:hypothetical protein
MQWGSGIFAQAYRALMSLCGFCELAVTPCSSNGRVRSISRPPGQATRLAMKHQRQKAARLWLVRKQANEQAPEFEGPDS